MTDQVVQPGVCLATCDTQQGQVRVVGAGHGIGAWVGSWRFLHRVKKLIGSLRSSPDGPKMKDELWAAHLKMDCGGKPGLPRVAGLGGDPGALGRRQSWCRGLNRQLFFGTDVGEHHGRSFSSARGCNLFSKVSLRRHRSGGDGDFDQPWPSKVSIAPPKWNAHRCQ
jgi:hypothetical protein